MGYKRSVNGNFLRVNFTPRGMHFFLTEENLNKFTQNRQSLIGFSRLFRNLKIEKKESVSFLSMPEFRGIEYVGYILEKERYDKSSQKWIRVDEIKIIGTEAYKFLDSRIVYGESYRYRIRTIVKYTFKKAKNDLSNLETSKAIDDILKEEIDKAIAKNQALLNQQTTPAFIVPKLSTSNFGYKKIGLTSDALATIKNGDIKIVQVPKQIDNVISPLGQQNNKLVDKALATGDLSAIDLERIKNSITETIQKTQPSGEEYVSQYFKSDPTKDWVYISATETDPPPVVQSLRVVPCSPKNEIQIHWLKPAGTQRDIKFFNIYRRAKVGDEWQKIADRLPETTTFFADKNINQNTYIYAISCVDFHDLESFLSIQIEAKLNPNFKNEKRELPLKWISASGTKPSERTTIVKKFKRRTDQTIIAKKNIVISPINTLDEESKNFIIKIRSLDTHEVEEIKLVLRNALVKQGAK